MQLKQVIIGLAIILAGSAAWYLGSPLFLNTVVDETLPVSTAELSDEEKKNIEELESLTKEQVDAMPEAKQMEAKKFMEDVGQKMPDEVIQEPMNAQPTTERSGTFKGTDSVHRGSGKAVIYTLADGSRILRFEDFSVTNGPALSVYLVPSADGEVTSDFLDLGKLKGNMGNQNYEIPTDVDLSVYRSVVIRCVPFRVTFATASLQ